MSQLEQIRLLFIRAEAASTGNETLELLAEAIDAHDEFARESEEPNAISVARNIRNTYLKACFLGLPKKSKTGLDEHGEFMRFLVLDAADETRDYVLHEIGPPLEAFLSVHKSYRDSELRDALDDP